VYIDGRETKTTEEHKMTASNFTIGQEVTFTNAFGVNVIESINGKTATTRELNTGLTYSKRLSSLKPYVQRKAYWNEQELVAPIHNHGDVVFSALSADGNGCMMVWDTVKKQCVSREELTAI
jgi:ABC-type transport system involved in Fe-S cluster assembly fused permease/ATPase subunit